MARRIPEVEWTSEAVRDLDEIATWIAEDAPIAARDFVRTTLEAAGSLGSLSERGRVVPEWDDNSVRELLVSSYRLIYAVSEKRVIVVVLIHQAASTGTAGLSTDLRPRPVQAIPARPPRAWGSSSGIGPHPS